MHPYITITEQIKSIGIYAIFLIILEIQLTGKFKPRRLK